MRSVAPALALATAAAFWAGVSAVRAASPGEVDSFALDLEGWTQAVLPAGGAGLTWSADGGGSADLVATGSGDFASLAMDSAEPAWIGDWTAAGISSVGVVLKNFGSETLFVRLRFGTASGASAWTRAATVPPGTGWTSYRWDVRAAALFAPSGQSATPAEVIASVAGVSLGHAPEVGATFPAVAGHLAVDDLRIYGVHCGDNLREADELCDGTALGGASCVGLGFLGGELACDSTCGDYIVSGCQGCGNGTCEVGETVAGCPEDCLGICGDSVATEGELCDGVDLGGRTCAFFGFDEGTLACNAGCDGFVVTGCTACGDGECNGHETTASCTGDCGAACGDGACNGGENGVTCFADCGTVCGDGHALGAEGCDGADLRGASCQGLGFQAGTLACGAGCQLDASGCWSCGDAVVSGLEVCDTDDLGGETCVSLGKSGGALACAPGCLVFDTAACHACGDGTADPEEVCDGTQLKGQTCVTRGFQGGALACAAGCGAFVTSGCYRCGDALCNGAETTATCPLDCGTRCGDGACNGGETTVTCGADCGVRCGDGFAGVGETCDGADVRGASCPALGFTAGTLGCASNCGALDTSHCSRCGNNLCELSESKSTCPGDCAPSCGDGLPAPGEACDEGALGRDLTPLVVSPTLGDIVGIVFDGVDNVWTLDDRRKLHTFKQDGSGLRLVTTINGTSPRDLDLKGGILYVTARDSIGIERYASSNGTYFGKWPVGTGVILSHPEAALFSGGSLLVVSGPDQDGGEQSIVLMSATTGQGAAYFGAGHGNAALALAGNGDVIALRGTKLWRFDGVSGADKGLVADAGAVAASLDGLVVADDGSFYTIAAGALGSDGSRQLLRVGATGTLHGPSALAVGEASGPVGHALAISADGKTLFLGIRDGPARGVASYRRGNAQVPGACRPGCVLPACGDGIVDPDELCDGQSGCGAGCEPLAGWVCSGAPLACAATCGNAIPDAGEACDGGDALAGDGCSANCRVEAGWVCNASSVCSAAACGDGIVAGAEGCEDKNAAGGDGCDGCQVEAGWACAAAAGALSVCTSGCGDGLKAGSEGCDDHDQDAGDGCDGVCRVERGWSCGGAGGCTAICGDGAVVGPETCDLGAVQNDPSCVACRIPAGYPCAGTGCIKSCNDGTGTVGASEQCEDGNLVAGDGCDPHCHIEAGWVCDGAGCRAARCGDGIAAGVESCDDGDAEAGDGCAACVLESGWVWFDGSARETCGDGSADDGEDCDDDNTSAGDGCSPNCRVESGWRCDPGCRAAGCGDKVRAGAEECDDGNNIVGDGCKTCQLEAGWICDAKECRRTCNDHHVDAGEECDDGGFEAGDGCDANCRVEPGWSCGIDPKTEVTACVPICGDGELLGSETCETANAEACIGCVLQPGWLCGAAACQNTCGDGTVQDPEACDDTNKVSGDGCSANCAVERGWTCGTEGCKPTRCGDAVVVGPEQCDDGNQVAGDGCTHTCKLEPGFVWTGGVARPTCGVEGIQVGEACDDGNDGVDDGCDANCRIEAGWVCAGEPSSCSAAECGDGIPVVGSGLNFEDCDDGNTDFEDGCTPECVQEAGWRCTPVCATVCGDGYRAGDETCDDRGLVGGDGCDKDCRVESGWTCVVPEGTHLSDCERIAVCGDKHPAGNEACDDGNDDPGDGCDACTVEGGWTCQPTLTTCVERDDDGDGLANNREVELGTDPALRDTDADGSEDGDEVQLGTNPTNADTDGDGVLDGVEVTNGTSPLHADTDGDEVDDAADNCPKVANPRQEDRDGDRLGSACDADESAGARLAGGSGCDGAGVGTGVGLIATLVGWLVLAQAARRRRRGR